MGWLANKRAIRAARIAQEHVLLSRQEKVIADLRALGTCPHCGADLAERGRPGE